jgi:hypothetical protein
MIILLLRKLIWAQKLFRYMQQADFLDNVTIRDLLVHENQQPSPSTKTFVL